MISATIISMKYFFYSDLWVEYSPMTPYYNRQLERKINKGIKKVSQKHPQNHTPSLTNELIEILHDNPNFIEGVTTNLIQHMDLRYQDQKCCISQFRLNDSLEFQLLFVPQNQQHYILTNTLLGKGDSGKAFLAKNLDSQEWVAVKRNNLKSKSKMIPAELTVLSPSKEYNVLHENEYLYENNKLLGQLIKKDPQKKYIYSLMPWYFQKEIMLLPVDEKIRLSISLADEISLLHSTGYLHNDLHLKNICWDGQKSHLIDFESMTRLDNIHHKYFYATHSRFSHLSPEGFFGFNTRSKDIYAYGKILQELFVDSPIECDIKKISNGLMHFMLNKRMSLKEAGERLDSILKNFKAQTGADTKKCKINRSFF